MFNYETVPKLVIAPNTLGEFSITDDGKFYWLHKNNNQLMCLNKNTNREIKEQYAMYDLAYGNVLITGWGFGILACWLASKPEVTSITVLELDTEVVELFLQNNQIPNKVTIEYTDARTYVTDKHYDCLLLDHFPDNKEWPVYKEIAQIANNIPHNLLWFYGLEGHYLRNFYDISTGKIDLGLASLEGYDFYTGWKDYANSFELVTFPKLDVETLTYYIKCYFNKLK